MCYSSLNIPPLRRLKIWVHGSNEKRFKRGFYIDCINFFDATQNAINFNAELKKLAWRNRAVWLWSVTRNLNLREDVEFLRIITGAIKSTRLKCLKIQCAHIISNSLVSHLKRERMDLWVLWGCESWKSLI